MKSSVGKVALLMLLCVAGIQCESDTVLLYRETIDVLDHIQPPVEPMRGRTISGFTVEDGTETRHRRYSFGPRQRLLEKAGAEAIACNDGTPSDFAHGDPLVRITSLIGDTGGDDVSDDADCHCDTRINYIAFSDVNVFFEDGTAVTLEGKRLEGRYTMCPNIPDGHHVRGGRDFNGAVRVTYGITLRVSDDNFSLLADVRYDVRSVN